MSETTIKLPELLPCPFCGGEARWWDRKNYTANYTVGCQNIDCFLWIPDDVDVRQLERYATCYRLPESGVEAWNKRAALNESDALRGGVEGLKAMVADIKTATFFFPNEPGGHLGTNADISFSRGEYRYHLSGDLPGTAETFAQAYAALKGQGEQNG